MDYDFTGLTQTQERLLTFQGWVEGQSNKPSQRTISKLLERGLIVEKPRHIGGSVPMAYIVPVHVHMLWCEHCASRAKRYARA